MAAQISIGAPKLLIPVKWVTNPRGLGSTHSNHIANDYDSEIRTMSFRFLCVGTVCSTCIRDIHICHIERCCFFPNKMFKQTYDLCGCFVSGTVFLTFPSLFLHFQTPKLASSANRVQTSPMGPLPHPKTLIVCLFNFRLFDCLCTSQSTAPSTSLHA